jgi:hypothetical protein
MKTLLALVALLATSGLASAGAEAHVFLDAAGQTHSADVYVADDGTVTVLVDGQPVAVPSAPGAPQLPPLPSPPSVPAPSLPSPPPLPSAPSLPALP